jgi:hypothetical protein
MRNNLMLAVLFLAVSSGLFAGSYQNVIRSTEDYSKSVFQIEKSSGAVQFMKEIQIPLTAGYITNTTAAVLSTSTTPGLEASAASGSLVIDWADGEVDTVAYSFRVPVDYNSGGRVLFEALSEANVTTSTKAYIGYRVNAGTVATTSFEVDAGSFEDVNVDFGTTALTLSAGDDVTILIGRNDSLSGTGTLQIKNVVFRYNDSMTLDR